MKTTINEFYEMEIDIKVTDKDNDKNDDLLTLQTLNSLRLIILEAERNYIEGNYMILYKEAHEYKKAFDAKIEELENKMNKKGQ